MVQAGIIVLWYGGFTQSVLSITYLEEEKNVFWVRDFRGLGVVGYYSLPLKNKEKEGIGGTLKESFYNTDTLQFETFKFYKNDTKYKTDVIFF